MTTDLIDRLNTYCDRGRASDRKLARLSGQTIEEFDADTTAPDPTGDLAERIALTPHTRMRFDCFCRVRHVDGGRMGFHEFLTDQSLAEAVRTLAQWDDLLIIYEHNCETEDGRDEHETQQTIRYAGVW